MAFGLAATIQAFPIPNQQPATSTTAEEAAPQHAGHWWDAAFGLPVIVALFIFDLLNCAALILFFRARRDDGMEVDEEEYEMTTMAGGGAWVQ